jgi:hypothetical protein
VRLTSARTSITRPVASQNCRTCGDAPARWGCNQHPPGQCLVFPTGGAAWRNFLLTCVGERGSGGAADVRGERRHDGGPVEAGAVGRPVEHRGVPRARLLKPPPLRPHPYAQLMTPGSHGGSNCQADGERRHAGRAGVGMPTRRRSVGGGDQVRHWHNQHLVYRGAVRQFRVV